MSRTNHRRPAPRRLRVERLEDRSLLAVAAFTIELHEDVGGLPGAVLAADEVQTGDSFFVEIRAQEFHPLLHGLHGVALNIAWPPPTSANGPVVAIVRPSFPSPLQTTKRWAKAESFD